MRQNPCGLTEPPLWPVSLTLSVSILIPVPVALVTAATVRALLFGLADLIGVTEILELSVIPRGPVSVWPSSL